MKSLTIAVLAIFGIVLGATLGSTANAGTLGAEKQKPAITMKQARDTAMKALPNGKIESAELEHEDGQFIYSFDMRVDGGIKEVWVDAMTGKVTKIQEESPEHEKNEAAQEKQEHRRKGR